jgi:hypothetical protein
MTDKEKIDEIKAGIYNRPHYYNGVYDLIQKAMEIDLNWQPNTLKGATFLEKQVDVIDSLLKEAVESGENIRDRVVLKRIGRKAITQTTGGLAGKSLIIIMTIIGLILWFFVI